MDQRRLVEAYKKTLGVDAETGSPDHYRLLGLKPFERDSQTIASAANGAYAKLMKWQRSEYQREVAHLMHEVVAARKILQDGRQKAAYDASLRGGDAYASSPTEIAPRGADPHVAPAANFELQEPFDASHRADSSPTDGDASLPLRPAEARESDSSGEANRLLEMHEAANQVLTNQSSLKPTASGPALAILHRMRTSEQLGAWGLSLLAICGMVAIIFGFKWVNSTVAKYKITMEAAEAIELGASRTKLKTQIGWPTTQEAGDDVYVYEGYDCELRVTFVNNDVSIVDFQSPEKTYRYERIPDGVRKTKSRLVNGEMVTKVQEGKSRIPR